MAIVIHGLLPLLSKKAQPNPEAVAYVMTLGYIPAPLSIWKGAYKLMPGHRLSWRFESGLKIEQYWSAPTEINYSRDYSLVKWEEIFLNVLQDHLLSDVPVSFFLSGGLDSTAIAIGLNTLNVHVKGFT